MPAAQKSRTINDNEMKFGGVVENHKHIKGRTIRSPGKGVGSYQKKNRASRTNKKNHAKVRPIRKMPALTKTNLAAPKLPKKNPAQKNCPPPFPGDLMVRP